MRRLRDSGNLMGSIKQPLWEYLDDWLRLTKKRELSPVTFSGYAVKLQHISDVIGDIAVGQVRPAHVRKLCAALTDQGMAPATVRGVHAVLRSALEQSFQDGILQRNPAASVRPPKAPNPKLEAPTLDAFEALLSACEGTRWHALFLILGTAGMRVSEALALHWTDLNGDVASITHSVTWYADGTLELGPTKTRMNRTVKLTPLAMAALDKHRIIQNRARLRAKSWEDQGLIFPGIHGGLTHRAMVNETLHKYLEKAGAEHFRVHDLRHFCATVLLEDGMTPHAVANQLGHSSPVTTLKRYAHVTAQQKSEGARRMDAILNRRA
jgi:integrase